MSRSKEDFKKIITFIKNILIKLRVIKKSGLNLGGVFIFTCYDKNGNLKWSYNSHNIVVNVGLQHILDVLFAGGTQVSTWYVGLTASSPSPAAADTSASHAGWTEFESYSEANRQTYVDARSNQTVSNSASKATFSINGSGTVGGAFLISSNTKGGSTGTLLCCVAGSDRSVISGDSMTVQYDFTAADDGA